MEANAYGLVSKIEHGSTHDGAGFRSVVYFAGCPLECKWCHNPELISPQPQLMYLQHKCVSCRQCLSACPQVFSLQEDRLTPERNNCNLCGKCILPCQGEALQFSAKKMSAEEVFSEIAADRVYYTYSGGGVTFTGGECFSQPAFLKELLRLCKESGIHTCVESCLFVPFSVIEELATRIDHFFVDIKLMDPEKHIFYTGQSNQRILENIRKLSALGSNITFRLPLIPKVNDSWENLTATVAFLENLPGNQPRRLELLRYNNLGKTKYESIQKRFYDFGAPQPVSEMEALARRLDKICDAVSVFYSH